MVRRRPFEPSTYTLGELRSGNATLRRHPPSPLTTPRTSIVGISICTGTAGARHPSSALSLVTKNGVHSRDLFLIHCHEIGIALIWLSRYSLEFIFQLRQDHGSIVLLELGVGGNQTRA